MSSLLWMFVEVFVAAFAFLLSAVCFLAAGYGVYRFFVEADELTDAVVYGPEEFEARVEREVVARTARAKALAERAEKVLDERIQQPLRE